MSARRGHTLYPTKAQAPGVFAGAGRLGHRRRSWAPLAGAAPGSGREELWWEARALWLGDKSGEPHTRVARLASAQLPQGLLGAATHRRWHPQAVRQPHRSGQAGCRVGGDPIRGELSCGLGGNMARGGGGGRGLCLATVPGLGSCCKWVLRSRRRLQLQSARSFFQRARECRGASTCRCDSLA